MEIIQNHYQWIFSGIGVLIVGYIVTYFTKKNKQEDSTKQDSTNTNTNSISIVNNLGSTNSADSETIAPNIQNTQSKIHTRILFVDDNHTDYKMVSILKKSGWLNTKSVKDITDLDDPKIIEANIIFVDINGVGTTLFQDQGLGLASALKKKYPEKYIVIYSSETKGNRFHKALREVDDCLYKDAEPIQFINVIETYTKSGQ